MTRVKISNRIVAVLALACLSLPAAVVADIVYMKSGKVYRGEVRREGGKVYLKTAMSGVPVTITLDPADIDRIAKTAAPSPPPGKTSTAPPLTLDTKKPLKDTITRPETMALLKPRHRNVRAAERRH